MTGDLLKINKLGTLPKKVTPEDSQEIKRLVERLNKNYKDDTFQFYRFSADFAEFTGEDVGDEVISKAISVSLEEQFKLVERYLECRITAPGWRFGGSIPSDYRMSADSVKDCDENRYGLKWEEKTVRAPLPQIKPPSIKVSESGKSDSRPGLVVSFAYEGYDLDDINDIMDNLVEEDGIATLKPPPGFTAMRCKERTLCEQMATDLKRLVEIARKYTDAGKKDDKKVQPSANLSQLKAAVFHAEGKSEKAGLSLAEARKLAKQVGAEIPDLPAIQHRKTGVPAIVRYINANRKPIIAKINGAYGREAAACFDLATSVYVLQFVYEGNNAKLKSQLIEHIKKTGAASSLPKNLWEPVVSKAEASAPIEEYNRVAVQMHVGVREYLDGKKQ